MKAHFRPWLYVALLGFSQLAVVLGIVALSWIFPVISSTVGTPTFNLATVAACSVAAVLMLYKISSSLSINDMAACYGLVRIKPVAMLLSCVIGAGFGIVAQSIAHLELKGVAESSALLSPFLNRPGVATIVLSILLLFSPFVEELVMRGCLYNEFRRSYRIGTSVLVIVALSFLLHWPTVVASSLFLIFFAVLQIILCLLIERTRSVFSSIACHTCYNSIFVAEAVSKGFY